MFFQAAILLCNNSTSVGLVNLLSILGNEKKDREFPVDKSASLSPQTQQTRFLGILLHLTTQERGLDNKRRKYKLTVKHCLKETT